MSLKSELREQFRGQVPYWIQDWEQALVEWLRRQPPGVWGAFVPLRDEAPILSSLQQVNHLSWAFPCVQGESLEFRRFQSPVNFATAPWIAGPFGREPGEGSLTVPMGELKGLLIPAVAYDRRGYRLGRGGGFYDRFLGGFRGTRVGVVHSSRILQEVPAESHDQQVEWLATENGVASVMSLKDSGSEGV